MKKILPVALFAISSGCMVNSDGQSTEQIGETAQALIAENVTLAASLEGSSTAKLDTNVMPKDWFPPVRQSDPSITLDWTVPASNCNPAAAGTLYSANGDGEFMPYQEPATKILGYWWELTQDLAGMENHWHNYTACDGSVQMDGCSEARKIIYALSVEGACSEAGISCTATATISLPAIHDEYNDTIEQNCPATCDEQLGQCVSWCQSQCTNGDSDCSNSCECCCKWQISTQDDSCQAPQSMCYQDTDYPGYCMNWPGTAVYTPTDALFTPNYALQ